MRHIQPYAFTHTIRVKKASEGVSLLDYFSSNFSYENRASWEERIQSKKIVIEGVAALPSTVLKENMVIYHHVDQRVEPDVSLDIEIIENHKDFLVVSKPAPMPVHPSGRFFKNSLHYILTEQGYGPLYVLHRLDSLTTGLVVFAKNTTFAKTLSTELSDQSVSKTYLARVSEQPKTLTWSIDAPIRRKEGFLFECHNDGKPALTHFEYLGSSDENEKLHIIKCSPKTGRTHQIRLHLAYSKYPIWNDPFYASLTSVTALNSVSHGLKSIDLHAFEFKTRHHTWQSSRPSWSRSSKYCL